MPVNTILVGDCVEVMATWPDACVDAVVTDPPYHLTTGKRGGSGAASVELDSPYGRARVGAGAAAGFMGTAWDGGDVAFRPETWAQVLRVLKPGGHLLAFGGTRTYHRLAVAVEDAGFEVRDCIAWLYGSGFPKSLDVSKAIDKAAVAKREVVGPSARHGGGTNHTYAQDAFTKAHQGGMGMTVTAPATDAARAWQGWGTALKPAMEPIVVARKPLSEKSVAANVLKHGTGGLNIDACRIEADDGVLQFEHKGEPSVNCYGDGLHGSKAKGTRDYATGRWPANVLLDDEAAQMLDEQSGERTSNPRAEGVRTGLGYKGANGDGGPAISGSTGGASRFFKVVGWTEGDRWHGEDRNEQTDATSPERAISGEPSEVVSDSSTTSSGSKQTGLFQPDTTSITATATSSTTLSPTWNSSIPSPTNASTEGANSETDDGGSPAGSAVNTSPSTPTGTSAARDGRSTDDVASATSASSWQPSVPVVRFKYTSKADTDERLGGNRDRGPSEHPTCKPVDLMAWLIRLVTPPGGVVLDCFGGSGSTAVAAQGAGFRWVLIEKEREYAEIALARIGMFAEIVEWPT